MMLLVVAYALLIAGLLGLTALCAERIFAELRWPRRGVWLAALTASIALPAYTVLMPADAADPTIVSLPAFTLLPDLVQAQVNSSEYEVLRATKSIIGSLQSWPHRKVIDVVVIAFWIASSALAFLVYILAGLRLQRVVKRFETITISGQEVVVSDRFGPAIFGLARPRVILPQWLANGDPALRELVMSHEREHIAAWDQLLLVVALLLVMTMPWNVALWWQLRRLRASIEVDCDARVLRGGSDALNYSKALLSVHQRCAGTPFGAVALTEPVSQLERRIRIMMDRAQRIRVAFVAMRLALIVPLVGLAFAVNAPQAQQRADGGITVQDGQDFPVIREPVYSRLAEAQSCVQAENFACARALLDEVVALDRNSYETAQYWAFLAHIQFVQGDTAGAVVSYDELLRLTDIPTGLRREALRNLVRLYRQTEQYQRAFAALDELFELDGEAPLSAQSLGGPVNDEFLPIVIAEPVYPSEAASQGLEGHVIVEYTVTESGLVTDAAVIGSSSEIFERAALDAVEKYKYRPRVEDSETVAVNGVQSVVRFELDN